MMKIITKSQLDSYERFFLSLWQQETDQRHGPRLHFFFPFLADAIFFSLFFLFVFSGAEVFGGEVSYTLGLISITPEAF